MENKNGFCRTCSIETTIGMKDIFTEKYDYSEIIATLTNLTIIPGDHLSQKICKNCAIKINNIEKFKTKCIQSDKILNEKLQSIIEGNVKIEVLSPEVILIQENRIFSNSEMSIKNEIKEEKDDTDWTMSDETLQNSITDEDSITSIELEENPKKKIKKLKSDKKIVKNDEKSPKIRKKPNHTLYSCDICGKMYQNQHLPYHLNAHNKIYPYACSFEGCDKKFAAPYRARKHETNFHSDNRPHTCDLCGKAFKKLQQLKIHRSYHLEPTIPCKVCNVLMKNTVALKKHMMTHTGEKPYACQYCEKSFAKSYNLKTHTRTHTGDKPYKCKLCEAAFGYGNLLKNHLERVHPGVN